MNKSSLILMVLCAFTVFAADPTFAATGTAGSSGAPNNFVRNANDSASGIPAMPYRVILNQQNAHLFAKALTRLRFVDGRKVIVLPLPRLAQDVQLTIPSKNGKSQGHILAWTTEKALPYKPQGSLEKQRITFESMHDSLAGALTALDAQHSAIIAPLYNSTDIDQSQRDIDALRPTLALIGTNIARTKRDIEFAAKRAAALHDALPMSQQFVIELETNLSENTEILVEYSYILPGSNWQPAYTFNADTKNNIISMQLVANITQNSDLDWHNAHIELTTLQGNTRSPRPISPWIIRQAGQPMPTYADSASPRAMMLESNAKADGGLAQWSDENAVASWVINKAPKIAEGNTQLVLAQETWNAPLVRIARPSVSNGTVWLSAERQLEGTFLPSGEATFLLDGAMVQKDYFQPKGDRASLFFGADPLVTVQTKDDKRRRAEQGIINKDQTWTWSWTYVLHNRRPEAVNVRVEEPETQVEDKVMRVTYADKPAPQKGPDATFLWNVSVPAKGSATISRNVTMTAPADMRLHLGKPY